MQRFVQHTKGNAAWHALSRAPLAEAKFVRCTSGALYDVVVDLRPDSPTFKEWIAVVLTARDRNMVYVPEGCAHGFLTLEDDTEVFYQMSEFYRPEAARGVRWDDPAFQIVWPGEVEVISERDRTYPTFEQVMRLLKQLDERTGNAGSGTAPLRGGAVSDLPEHHRRWDPTDFSRDPGPHSSRALRYRLERRSSTGPYRKSGTFETPI